MLTNCTSTAPGRYRLRDRAPDEIDLVVLHQTGTRAGLSQTALDKTRAHALILDSGEILHLHPWTARLRYGSGPWNARCISIEHRANLPGRYVAEKGRWWRPDLVPPDAWDPDARRAQVLASRRLLRLLRSELPALRYVAAHRMVQKGKGGCCGPDIWREVGEWALSSLGLELMTVAPTGSVLPTTWRQPSTILDAPAMVAAEPLDRAYDGPLEA